MKPTTFTLFAVLLFGCHIAFAQNDWRTMIQNHDLNFYTIQRAYEQEMVNVPYEKGLGIKQFKRWEYYWESRVDEQGNFPRPGAVLEEIERYYSQRSQQRSYLTGSGNWSLLGPVAIPSNGTGQLNGNGRLTSIAFHPTDPNTFFVGAPAGGIWKTTDAGASWTNHITGMTRLGVSGIVINNTNPNIMYIATGDRDGGDVPGYGVWRSTDGGLTWAPRNNGMGNRTINDILIHPTNPNILIAAGSNGIIYRSNDGGANWAASASLGNNPKDIAMHPGNPNIIYASGTRVHRSTDGGATWTRITGVLPNAPQRMALAVSPDEPNWVYVLAGAGNGLEGIYRSTNSGVSFTLRTNTPNILDYALNGSGTNSQAWYDLVIAADPTDANTIYTGGINLWKSTDGGSTMNSISYWVGPSGGRDGVHADQHSLDFSPLNGALYNGNDGGLYVSADQGVTWGDLSGGLAIAQVYKIGVSQQTEDLVINGYQDNGTGISQGTFFQTEIGGDGMECIIDPTDDQFMYGALYYGDIRRSTNGGNTFAPISNPIGEQGAWVTPYKLDPNNPNRMFAGYDNVWRNNAVRTGTVWEQISNFASTANIRDIAVAPSNSNVVYISKNDNSLRVSNNALAANPTWTNLSANLPVNNEPLDIEIDPTDPLHLFIALNRNIYESTNGGNSWTDISGTLPNINLNTILIDKDSPVEAMYVGMDVGVYYRDNTLADWEPYSTALPNLEITELEIHYNAAECKSFLYAATYGQGLWKSDLKDPGTVATVACFEASETTVCMGIPVNFIDHSDYTPTSWVWTITPNTFNFTSSTTANSQNPSVAFTAPGTYTVELTVNNGVGADTETKTGYIVVSSASIATNFDEDFETQATCGTISNCATTNCNITGLWSNVANGSGDDIDWRIDVGGTPSTGTGPTVDFNPGTNAGNYAYMEASSCFNRTAILLSDCIQLDRAYRVNVGYHMTGNAVGSLHLDLLVGGAWNLDFVPPINTDQGTAWRVLSADLAAFTGQTIRMRLRGITGAGFQSDIAIDDINFSATTLLQTHFAATEAVCAGNGFNNLSWKLSDDQHQGFYNIEKFVQGEWKVVDQVEAQRGKTAYEWLDQNPFLGENLYRVGMANVKENAIYSRVTVANCAVDINRFVLYPNPFSDKINLQLYAPMAAQLPYTITNTLGQILHEGTFQTQEGVNNFALPMGDLPKGFYLFNTQGKMVKLIKN
ncbi:MAG: VPS10 domain-containing protein [Aureispira sp.]